jgi:hypothetical protein
MTGYFEIGEKLAELKARMASTPKAPAFKPSKSSL